MKYLVFFLIKNIKLIIKIYINIYNNFMYIEFSCNLTEKLEFGDKAAINTKNISDNISISEMIQNFSFSDLWKDLDAENKLKKIESIINNDKNVNLQIVNLSITKKFNNSWSSNNSSSPTLAFVFKLSEKLDNYCLSNAIVVFCSTREDDEDNAKFTKSWKFNLKRIEHLEINFLETKIEGIWNSKINLNFVFNSLENKYNGKVIDPNLKGLLDKSKKITDYLNKEDSKIKFKFNEWNDFIYFLQKYYKDKEKEFDYVISEKDFTEDINNIKNCDLILCHKTNYNYTRFTKNLFLYSDSDESSVIKIEEIKELDYFSKLEKDIKTNENTIKEISDNIQDIDIEINKCEEKIKSENNSLTDKLTPIKNSIKNFEDEISIKENKLVELNIRRQKIKIALKEEKKEEQIDKLKRQESCILDEINKFSKEKESIKNNLSIENEKVEKIENKITKNKELERDIKNSLLLQKQKQEEDRKKWNEKITHSKKLIDFFKKNNIINFSNVKISSESKNDDINKKYFSIQNIHTKVINEDILKWQISEQNNGMIQIIKRYRNSFKNIEQGFYKNPFLFYSMLSIPTIEKFERGINNDTKRKYNLNDKQLKTLEKALNIRDIFYLQGPPGTGKTQTIAAITEEYIRYKNNILMTSSTHEAINNFFDRLNDNNECNPNLILLKYRFGKEENQPFDEKSIYPNFFRKIVNFVKKEKDSLESDEILKAREIFINKYNKKIPNFLVDSEREIINNLSDSDFKEIISTTRFNFLRDEEISQENCSIEIIREAIDFFSKKNSSRVELEYKDIWSLLVKNKKNIVQEFKDFNFEEKNDEYFFQMIDFFDKSLKEKKLENYEKTFLEYIKKNKLINVIGISTTAKAEIEILNEKMTLFSDYPIDLTIIDEISKSTTPEILARTILSKKVIFAGDYKQLPPVMQFSEEDCKNFYNHDSFKDFIKKYKQQISDDNSFYDFVNNLYTTSFFKSQVLYVLEKNKNTDKRPYENLTYQHRFTKNIMDCVNVFYEDDEKLEMPETQKDFNKYTYNLKDYNPINCETSIIDSSKIDVKYESILKEKNIILLEDRLSFDSKTKMDRNRKKYDSNINEYNSYIINEIVSSLIRNKSRHHIYDDSLTDKIGIITMTKSQKYIIKELLEKNDETKKIRVKVDTVDNFQGREKDIIIVDLVRAPNKLDQNRIQSGKSRNLKHYLVLERLNVAFSRAKSMLIIVGAFKEHFLKKSTISNIRNKYSTKAFKFFEDVYNIIKKMGAIVDYGED